MSKFTTMLRLKNAELRDEGLRILDQAEAEGRGLYREEERKITGIMTKMDIHNEQLLRTEQEEIDALEKQYARPSGPDVRCLIRQHDASQRLGRVIDPRQEF